VIGLALFIKIGSLLTGRKRPGWLDSGVSDPPPWIGALKPQQVVIAHENEKPVNQHEAGSQWPPDIVSNDQQYKNAEDDK
jgi:hypothetical protein